MVNTIRRAFTKAWDHLSILVLVLIIIASSPSDGEDDSFLIYFFGRFLSPGIGAKYGHLGADFLFFRPFTHVVDMANANISSIYRFQSKNSQGIRELKRQDNRTRLRARVNIKYFTYGREEVILFYPCVNTPQTSINPYSADNHKHFSVVQTLEQGLRRLFFQEHTLFLSMLRTVQYIESNHSETLTSICRVKKKKEAKVSTLKVVIITPVFFL